MGQPWAVQLRETRLRVRRLVQIRFLRVVVRWCQRRLEWAGVMSVRVLESGERLSSHDEGGIRCRRCRQHPGREMGSRQPVAGTRRGSTQEGTKERVRSERRAGGLVGRRRPAVQQQFRGLCGQWPCCGGRGDDVVVDAGTQTCGTQAAARGAAWWREVQRFGIGGKCKRAQGPPMI